MDHHRMAELLQPFISATELPAELLDQLQLYLDLLLRWNARVNLTAVRDPEQIVTRHFGESLFAAQTLKQCMPPKPFSLADVGSGAGFPGIPIKLLLPHIDLTLIESHNKKATFLREVLRALKVERAGVFCGRAEQWQSSADVVTMRAVEQFERSLPAATALVAPHGSICLLIGAGQVDTARKLLPQWTWAAPISVPQSEARVVLVGGPGKNRCSRGTEGGS